jgi:hypothetical protein
MRRRREMQSGNVPTKRIRGPGRVSVCGVECRLSKSVGRYFEPRRMGHVFRPQEPRWSFARVR